MSQWASGNTCTSASQPNYSCVQGGWPEHIIKATTVRHVQVAVNFASNNNIRIVIKNSDHELNGNWIGGYSLTVWKHNLKGMTYEADYTSLPPHTLVEQLRMPSVEAYEDSALMRQKKVFIIVAGGSTVHIAGSFPPGDGHSSHTSYYGFAAEQGLAITSVTADGRVVEAHEG
jgi:hypothetical protein